jgi:glutamate formiminotransferase / 5-formyltetrahydrofolate cyclo-ligase
MAKYILSDPNFSDGTHSEVIEKIIDQFRGRPGVKLIGYEPDPDFDRLPAELLGRPEAMREALLDAAGAAYELIDMEKQHGGPWDYKSQILENHLLELES